MRALGSAVSRDRSQLQPKSSCVSPICVTLADAAVARYWLQGWVRIVKRDAVALCLATRDPRATWYARSLAALIAAYAFSPINLIPDFIPIIGYLDELILLPLAIAGVVRLVHPAVMAERRATAAQMARSLASNLGAALIAATWMLAIVLVIWWLMRGR
jgi:uncharacterized membrane protein YkvA (DUF1232 family)